MQKLTEAEVAALPVDGRDRIVFDTMLSGFGVRVTPAGRKIYLVQASVGGRSRKVSIGHHPDMTLADARREARSALDAIRAGKDPAGEKTSRLAARAAGAVTVAELADRWLAEYVRPKLKPRTARDYVQLIEQNQTATRPLASLEGDQERRRYVACRHACDAEARQLHRRDLPRPDDVRRGLRTATGPQ
jgi:hypothetical protein